ncbi:MAG: hypothetical protein SWJ54_10205 [Cyanobacteriota bacterium]|nr:hypothetical protein [Cyanobacteriota bacterium]
MKKKTYYLAASIFVFLGFIGLFFRSVAWFVPIMLGCFLVGLIYVILGYQQRD